MWQTRNFFNDKSREKLFMILSCMALAFLFLFILNYLTPYTSDDYRYHYIYEGYMPQDGARPLAAISDIFESTRNHYNMWGGRVVAHSILQFFMLFDKTFFDVFNSLVYVLCGALIYLMINPDFKKWKPLHLLGVYASMWIFWPQFGISVLWMSGACNYLWMMTLILLFILPYRLYSGVKMNLWQEFLFAIFMVPFGFISGCTNENSAGAVLGVAALFVIKWIVDKKRIPIWSITGILFGVFGLAFLVVAPGNYSRGGKATLTLELLKSRCETIFEKSFDALFIVFIILCVVLICYIVQRKPDFKTFVSDLYLPIMLLLASAASIVVLLASPEIYIRSWIFAVVSFIISIGNVLTKIDYDTKLKKSLLSVGLVVMIAISAVSYSAAFLSIRKTYVEVSSEFLQIIEQKQAGIKDVTVDVHEHPENVYNALNGTVNLTEKRNSWFNSWMAEYYGVDSIGIKEEKH